MRKIITNDNSETFFNDEFNETYHSNTGAVEESYEKFAKPCLEFLKDKKEINVLDFCFGLGYNSAALIELLDYNINIICIDNDDKIFGLIKEVNPKMKNYDTIKKLNKNNLTIQENNIKIKLIIGDALKVIDELPERYFDVVLFDPFSPKVCPELWQERVFKKIYDLMKPNSVLTTYSCARKVRDNLKIAGFLIKDGPKVKRRGPSTIASKIQ